MKHLIFTFVFIIKVLQVTSSEMTSLWNFSWVRLNEVAASSAPKNSEDLQWLQSQGIKQVLCLDKDYIKELDLRSFSRSDCDWRSLLI